MSEIPSVFEYIYNISIQTHVSLRRRRRVSSMGDIEIARRDRCIHDLIIAMVIANDVEFTVSLRSNENRSIRSLNSDSTIHPSGLQLNSKSVSVCLE